jgi:pimeloyl-ACP methyl ester carboxylesterase
VPQLDAAGGARLHYDDEGTGPLVLLVHGGTGTGAYDWQYQRERLAESWAALHLDDESLRRIAIPTLVVAGDRDTVEPVETALALARTLPAGELLVVPGAGHFAARDRPAEVTFALEQFLARHLQEDPDVR